MNNQREYRYQGLGPDGVIGAKELLDFLVGLGNYETRFQFHDGNLHFRMADQSENAAVVLKPGDWVYFDGTRFVAGRLPVEHGPIDPLLDSGCVAGTPEVLGHEEEDYHNKVGDFAGECFSSELKTPEQWVADERCPYLIHDWDGFRRNTVMPWCAFWKRLGGATTSLKEGRQHL